MTTAEVPDVSRATEEVRAKYAWALKNSSDVPWPDLPWFNSRPCSRHTELTRGCNRCGISLRKHQRIGAAWLYVAGKGLLSDVVGSGKTAQVLAVLAMCKAHNELGLHNRAVIVCKAAAVGQWYEQCRRLLPHIPAFPAMGSIQQRTTGYLSNWEIAIVSDRTFSPARGRQVQRDGDVEMLREFPVGMLFYDDIDAMRNPDTTTSYAINRMALDCTRVVGIHGTPLQKRLVELWSFLRPVGGVQVLGSQGRVRQRYVTQNRQIIWVADRRDPTHRKRVKKVIFTDAGINTEHIQEFKELVSPLILRRTVGDLDDVSLPAVQVNPVYLDLSPKQRARYEELRKGTLRRLKDGQEDISHAEAGAAFMRGWQICSGLASLDGPANDVSAKFDWVIDKLTGDLDGEKAVCFIYFKDNVEAFCNRLTEHGIKHVTFWSAETNQQVRETRRRQFMEDPEVRVLVGTTTIEQSLNLQAAAHLIAVDTILNPARMEQLVGRVRRQDSRFPIVFFHHLLAKDTQEDGYLALLTGEQAMADMVWGEESEIFQVLHPRQLMSLVAHGNALAA
jgi:SNF2 family DNA or RNA helicase